MAYSKSDPRHPMNAERTGRSSVEKIVNIAKPKRRPTPPKRKKGVNCSTGKYSTE